MRLCYASLSCARSAPCVCPVGLSFDGLSTSTINSAQGAGVTITVRVGIVGKLECLARNAPAFGTFWAYLPSPRYELTPRRSRYLPTGTGHRPSRRPSYLPTLPSWNLSLLLKVAAETVKLLAPFATNHDARVRSLRLFCDPCARPSPGFLAPTPCAHGTDAAAGPLRGHDR